MEPEKTPRSARAGKTNMTIDLEATKADPYATGAQADAAASADSELAQATPLDAADNPHVDTPPVDTFVPPFAEKTNDSAKAETPTADEIDAAAAFSQTPPHAARATETASPRTPSSAGALAAGILGGLIALIAAGSLQYAGVLPSFGSGTGDTQMTQQLTADIEALKAQTAGGAKLEPLESRVAALETAAGAIGNETGELPGLKAELKSVTDELASVKTQLADARQATDTVKTDLATRLDAAEQKLDAPASDVQLARAIAVTALKTAIDRGGPFLAELDALKSISPDDPAVAGLANIAATGVESRADLTGAFPDVAASMLDAVRYSDPDQGVLSRLIDSAGALIRVRPVGSIDGEGPDAVIARIENKLTNGDLKGAALEWDALPQEAKTAGAAFRTKLDQRIRAEDLIQPAVSGAMKTNQG